MAAHLDEQQELDNFKHFWKGWGRWLFALLLAGGLSYLGYVWYQSHLDGKNKEAAALLAQMVDKAQISTDPKALNADLQHLQQNYPASTATAQATFMAAAAEFDKGNYPAATAHYNWILSNQKDSFVLALAVQRLAVTQLQQKQFDQALKTLETAVDPAFEALIQETKGDVLVAQNKPKEALAAYEAALNKTAKNSKNRELLDMKILRLK